MSKKQVDLAAFQQQQLAQRREALKQSSIAKTCPEYMRFLETGVAPDEDVPVILRAALDAAIEHLDYTGYGDSWERECADASQLSEALDDISGAFR